MPETTPLPLLRWPCDLARPAPHRVQIFRGETVRLEALLTLNGAPVEIPAGATATLAWQSREMGGSWYVAEASLDTERGTVWADFGPDKDAGADEYRAFLRVDTDGACYRAVAALQILPSPGATINEIPIPPRVLDFATIEVLNAPYWTKAEADARFASVADATLNGRGFGEWTVSAAYETTIAWWNGDDEFPDPGWVPYFEGGRVGMAKGDASSTSLEWRASEEEAGYDITATRAALPGYVLGSQTEKPIPKLSDIPAVVAPSTSASDAGKAADAKATGDALAGKLGTNGGGTITGDLSVSGTVTAATVLANSMAIANVGTLYPETWTFEVDDGQGGTTTTTRTMFVLSEE